MGKHYRWVERQTAWQMPGMDSPWKEEVGDRRAPVGAKTIRVTKKEEVDDAIKTAIAANEPVVIEVIIDHDDKVWPMVAPGAPIEEAFDEKDQENRIYN